MDNKELKKKLVDMRNSIQDYLDNLDIFYPRDLIPYHPEVVHR